MDKEKVLKLANLARVKISEEEAESLSHEFEGILNYVGEVKAVSASAKEFEADDFPVRNVMRQDSLSHEGGLYTEDLLNQAPKREGDKIRVKKIL